jgi:hypothetical protein
MNKLKYAYLAGVSLCFFILLFYYFFDIINYFEIKYEISKIDREKEPFYDIYDIRMGHIYKWYRIIFFSSISVLIISSGFAYFRVNELGLNKKIPVLVLLIACIILFLILFKGSFQKGPL